MRTLHRRPTTWLLPVLVLSTPMLLPLFGGDHSDSGKADKQPESPEVVAIINRIIAREKLYDAKLREYSPRVETYVQYDEKDTELGDVPRKDAYFLGRLKLAPGAKEASFIPDSIFDWLRRRPEMFMEHLHLDEFALEPLAVDEDNFDRDHYDFEPVRREMLGDVHCLALDVRPRKHSEGRAFEGRIWVEDHNYAVVRLNGTRLNPPRRDLYVHFDCWRENLRPGVWLPVYIFSHESDLGARLRYKAETRLWGYSVTPWRPQKTQTPEETNGTATHHRKGEEDKLTTEEEQRVNISAEHNVLKRLERAGLMAPPGPVDKVLDTVLNNLVITNHLDKLPPLQCRVLLTSTLESFSLAYTIVLSRGLIDVLPDEPSLAMILAHELAHITLPHKLNTQYARANGMDVPDEKLLASMDLARDQKDEAAADAKGMDYLKNSPYKDNLGQAGLFLQAAADAAQHSPHLFGPHVGNGLTEGSRKQIRMAALTTGAPALSPKNVDQISALPLGSRVQVNAWDGSIAFTDRKAVPLVAPSEKMSFQVNPIIPHLRIIPSP
ncbi:MAG: M48 family metalloprotease [Terriglobia bacterium]